MGELVTPLHGKPVATLLTLHPLPTHGGMMDSHVLRKAANRLPALAGYAVLRFNTRGTESVQGRSEGSFDNGGAERLDVLAAHDFAQRRGLPRPWWLAWSFGTDLALRYGLLRDIEGAILLSPPLRSATDDDLDRWAASGVPVTILVPEFDDYLPPGPARQRFSRLPQAKVIAVEGAKHLWVGERYVQRALDEIVSTVTPDVAPLPRVWDGPVDTATV